MTDDAIFAILTRLEAKLDAALDRDLPRLQVLLPQIAAVTKGMSFAISDLLGEVDLGGFTLPQVGLLLKRNRHRVIAGYQITRIRRSRGGLQWLITAIADPSPHVAQSAPLKSTKRG
jgi:hypothetical protein